MRLEGANKQTISAECDKKGKQTNKQMKLVRMNYTNRKQMLIKFLIHGLDKQCVIRPQDITSNAVKKHMRSQDLILSSHGSVTDLFRVGN